VTQIIPDSIQLDEADKIHTAYVPVGSTLENKQTKFPSESTADYLSKLESE
jgi:hypothetical protein